MPHVKRYVASVRDGPARGAAMQGSGMPGAEEGSPSGEGVVKYQVVAIIRGNEKRSGGSMRFFGLVRILKEV